MWRYRILLALFALPAYYLAKVAAPEIPFWKNPAFLAIMFAYLAGRYEQKFGGKIVDHQARSFRLSKDKW